MFVESSRNRDKAVTVVPFHGSMRVLIVEDDRQIAALLRQALCEDGYSVAVASRGEAALTQLLSESFDAVVLDIMLPDLSGFGVLKTLRERHQSVPVLMLTARDSMTDIVRGLDLGADDYMTKPFALEILLARIRALCRRRDHPGTAAIQIGTLSLDRELRVLHRADATVPLTRKEFLLLELLMRRCNQVVTRYQLIEAGWGGEAEVNANSLDFYISSLRSKIASPDAPMQIRTLRSLGYSLTACHGT